jgi:hypothetical protein
MRKWVAKFHNKVLGGTNVYLVSDEPLNYGDNYVYIKKKDDTSVINPEHAFVFVDNTRRVKVLWVYDANKGHDTFIRTYIGNTVDEIETKLSIFLIGF